MVYVLVALIALGLWLYSLVEVLTTDEADVRLLTKFGWVMIVLLTLIVGAVLWLLFGRPSRRFVSAARRSSAPRGPDDDPEFLRQIERRLRGDD